MKAVPFIPLAYIAGAHGFALFAPYAAFVLLLVLLGVLLRTVTLVVGLAVALLTLLARLLALFLRLRLRGAALLLLLLLSLVQLNQCVQVFDDVLLDLLRTTPAGKHWFKRAIVEGYASQSGKYLFNLNLSLERSERGVQLFFIGLGVIERGPETRRQIGWVRRGGKSRPLHN